METKHPPAHGAHGPGAGYEQRDANIPDLLSLVSGWRVVIFVTLLSMKWTFNYFERTQTVRLASDSVCEDRASFRQARDCRWSRIMELQGLLRGAESRK